MRTLLLALAATIMLGGCQTVKPLEPLQLADHQGGAVVQVCFGEFSQDRVFTLVLREFDTKTKRILADTSRAPLDFTLKLGSTTNTAFKIATYRRDCTFWQFSAPPGDYAIVSFGERMAQQNPMTTSLAGILIGAIIQATANNDSAVFITHDGSLTDRAPTFAIRAGEVTHLGTIVFIGEREMRQVPAYEKDGTWDGFSTDSVLDRRLIVRYQPAGTGEIDSLAIAGPYEASLPRQTIANFVDRTILIEDFPEREPLYQ